MVSQMMELVRWSCEAPETIANLLVGVVQLDPWLSPFKEQLRKRYSKAQDWITAINKSEGGLEKFSRGTEKYGFNVDKQNNITYREWAPNATQAFLIGDFSIPPFILDYLLDPFVLMATR
jgi:1,4-alpha-glucan branching enzyme